MDQQGPLTALTSGDNFFEDFETGQTIRHSRGKDMGPTENIFLTNMVMNTADGHFNSQTMADSPFGQILCYGGINLSLVMGLASQDTIENALREVGLDNVRLTHPVYHGDTLSAYSRVLIKQDAQQEDAGLITFRHFGVNQNDALVCSVDRTALIKRRSHWAHR